MQLISRLRCFAAVFALLLAGPGFAQTGYPSKPVHFVVPYPPGGPTDLMARMLQPELQKRLGVTVIIDNKAGAGGNIGSAEVARHAPADGYTILLAASGPMAVNQSLFRSMPFNPLTDLAPVIQISSFPLVLEAHPSLGIKTLEEFITRSKARPEDLNYASAGNGTPQHLAGQMYSKAVGANLLHVPYKGAGPALNDLLGGQVKVMFDIVASSLQYINTGKLVPIAVTSSKRSPMLPNVPTFAEAGLPNFEVTAWHGIAVRAGTPEPIIARLNTVLNETFKDPEFRKKWEEIGTPVVGGTPERFAQLMKTESVRLGRLVRDSGVTLE